jgi:STE24 endopeptidase
MVLVVSWAIGWPRTVRFDWRLDRVFLVDELLILLPVLLPLVLSWAAFYGIERAAYSARGAAGMAATGPAPSLSHYLSVHARHYLGVMLVPILVLLAVQDAVALWLPGIMQSGWSVAVYAAPIGLMVLFYPLLLRRLWKTRPLAEGLLRKRLTAAANRAGLPIREILVWETGGMIVNAALSGWIPGRRYVFLTDGLIARLSAEEIEAVFGHELGHIRHRHLMLRGLVMLAPLSLILAVEMVWPDSAALTEAMTAGLDATAQLPLAVGMLVVVSSYAFFVFGGYCRLLETEADLFGCRMLQSATPEDAIGVFISALEKLGVETGSNRRRSTWQHPSIARRTEFLTETARNPGRGHRFERRVRWLNWLLGLCILSPVAIAVFL